MTPVMIHGSILPAVLGCAGPGGVMLCLWRREPPSWAGRLLLLAMAVMAADAVCAGLGGLARNLPDAASWQRGGMTARSIALLTLVLFTLIYARSNYREFLRWWAWPLSVVALALASLTVAGWDDILSPVHPQAAPPPWRLALGRPGSFILALQLLMAAAALMNLERTIQAAVGTLRWKIKLMALGLGVILITQVYTITQALIFEILTPRLIDINLIALAVGSTLIIVSLLRTNLSGDLFISTHLLFRSLTILGIGGYLVCVGVAAQFFVPEEPGRWLPALKILILLLALVGLALVLLSDRLRLQARILLSRHLHRPRYDHREVWATLIHRTASAPDAPTFCRQTANWLSETFEILSVTIWLIDEPTDMLTPGGSTRPAEASPAPRPGTEAKILAQGMRQGGALVDLHTASGAWVEQIRQLSPDTFNVKGPCICLPLLAGTTLVGMMVLTDRVQQVPLTTEEQDLIQTIASHVAARLFVYRLSEQVLQARQLEAFQAMSTFFVHDLKNTAATLSLMLQNLPTHFDDPSFRADALRAVSRSVDRINAIITKLALFRQGMSITPVPSSLNSIITGTLAETILPPGVKLKSELLPLPVLPLDPEQIRNVIANLVINACDAMSQGGELTLGTRLAGSRVLLSVRDTGGGMSGDFIRKSLFQPFRTTKPKGLGIGLFHARIIIENHGGRIDVESEPGHGTLFKVWLPVEGGAHEAATVDRG